MKRITIDGVEYELVKVKTDFEIMSFSQSESILMVDTIPSFYSVNDYLQPDSLWKIHSVKRLSDGEVFTVGDMANIFTKGYECVKPFTINDFKTDGKFCFVNQNGGRWNIMSLKKNNRKENTRHNP